MGFSWNYCIGIVCVLLMAFCYFAYHQQWIIIQGPRSSSQSISEATKKSVTKKRVKRIFWRHDAWHTEETELLWADDKAENCMHLITSWLTLLDEEAVMEKKVSLQSVVFSPSGIDAYCSFDRNPFDKNDAVFDKLMWVEGLLKTMRENDIKIQSVQFLVHHQSLHDFHLDFSNPWPITGFVTSV